MPGIHRKQTSTQNVSYMPTQSITWQDTWIHKIKVSVSVMIWGIVFFLAATKLLYERSFPSVRLSHHFQFQELLPLPICRVINMCRPTAPDFQTLIFTDPFFNNFTVPTFPNFTAPIFFVTILHILHYIIYHPHFLTTAFTAPIFRHPDMFTVPALWRWVAHM